MQAETTGAPIPSLLLRKSVQFHTGRGLTANTPDRYAVVLSSDQPRPLVVDVPEYLNIVDNARIDLSRPPK